MPVALSLTVGEEDMAKLVEAGPLQSAQEVADFLDCTHEERMDIIADYKAAGVAKVADAWSGFVTVAGGILSLAGAVTGISGAVNAVFGLTKL